MAIKFKTRSQNRVQRYRTNPGYHSRLPHVFPYFWNGSADDVMRLTSVLMEVNTGLSITVDDGTSIEPQLWFGVTGHNSTVDGHITLWLSADAARWLLMTDAISSVLEYERG